MLETDTLYTLCDRCNGYGVLASWFDDDGTPSGIQVCDLCQDGLSASHMRRGGLMLRAVLVFTACAFFAAVGVYDATQGSLGLGIASLCVAAANALYLTA